MPEPLDLTGPLTARMCHDLANPLGAIGNGLELFTLSGIPLGEEGALIQASLAAAKARLQVFRIAYGSPVQGEKLGSSALKSIETAWNTDARVQISLPNIELEKADLQKILLLMQCITTALPLGGAAKVATSSTGYTVTATGRKVVIDPSLWAFDAPIDNQVIDPKQIQFILLTKLGLTPKFAATDTNLTVMI